MDDWKLPWEGGCRCGALRFRVTLPPMLSGACHCAGCQRMSASAFSMTLSLSVDGFEVTSGEPVLGGMRQEPKHYHCAECKSWVFTKPTSLPWLVNVRSTMLDDHAWVRPFVEFYRDEGYPWAVTGAKYSWSGQVSDAEIQQAVAEHAAEGARPG